MKRTLVLLVLMILPAMVFAQDDLNVMTNWRMYSDIENALYKSIAEEAYGMLDSREDRLSLMRTRATWELYRNNVRRKLADAFGPMPEKTPLNARIVNTFEHEGLTVENILFESRPGFYVTSALFRPSNKSGKLPVVVYVCGHSANGYRLEGYQNVIMNLAHKGMAVLAVDPMGQGERLQYYDPEQKKSVVGGPTREHSYAGLQYLLTGRTMAMARLWDGICAIDYLHTRDDIDTSRIGVHGRSGGGTMSTYLGAMDERIMAAAPECYITSFRRLFQTIGPQDAEQNLLSQIATSLDHGDFLIARAPKPTLVVTTANDIFSLQGARETVEQVRPAFESLGGIDAINMIEDEAPHQSTKPNRERVYAFFMKTFGVRGDSSEREIPVIDTEKLTVTKTGQVLTSGSKNIHDLIAADSKPYIDSLERLRAGEFSQMRSNSILKDARTLSGYRQETELSETITTGRIKRDGYTIEKIIIDSKGQLPVPALLFRPDSGGKHPAILSVSQAGKNADSLEGGIHESLVREGYIVLACDLPGFGEMTANTQGNDSIINGVSFNIVFGAQLIGRSTTGILASAISKTVSCLAARKDVDANSITAISMGICGPSLLHAAVFDTAISRTILVDSPLSWSSIAENRFYDQNIAYTIVPSALTAYDLPDLVQAHAGRDILIIGPQDGTGTEISSRDIIVQTRDAHTSLGSHVSVVSHQDSGDLTATLLSWLAK